MKSSKSNEWYTPSKYIEAARAVMGSIDLDPASCELANRTVKATRYYTKEENGLAQPWYGNVWLNPPYGRLGRQSGTTAFIRRLLRAFASGEIDQACALVLTGMYARWFFDLLIFPCCFLEEKPLFTKPDGTQGSHAFAASCFYLGPYESRFIEVFSAFGTITRCVSPALVPLATQLELEAL